MSPTPWTCPDCGAKGFVLAWDRWGGIPREFNHTLPGNPDAWCAPAFAWCPDNIKNMPRAERLWLERR